MSQLEESEYSTLILLTAWVPEQYPIWPLVRAGDHDEWLEPSQPVADLNRAPGIQTTSESRPLGNDIVRGEQGDSLVQDDDWEPCYAARS